MTAETSAGAHAPPTSTSTTSSTTTRGPERPPAGSRAVPVSGVVLVAVVWLSAALFGAYILVAYAGALADSDLSS